MTQPQLASDHIEVEMDAALRTKALEALLVEKGLISTDAIDEVCAPVRTGYRPPEWGQSCRSRLTRPGYKARLLEDGTAAIAEMGYIGRQGADMVVLENTPTVHNVVVCTLCSCYPWPVLGLPPTWYKSFAYRSRVVREPRAGVTRNLVWTCRIRLRFACGTATLKCAIWSCPNNLPARNT